jgi:hypothetical protein
VKPEPMILHCPKCDTKHIDIEEWATRPHKVHLCLNTNCNHEWQPSSRPTVGVDEDVVGEIETWVSLPDNHSAIIFDREGNIVESILAGENEDDIAGRGALLAAMLITCPREELDRLINNFLGTPSS